MKNIIFSILAIFLCAGKATGQIANIDMVFVKGGTFTMGCVDSEYACIGLDGGIPAHSVTVSDFYIGKYPVTQKQWKDVMGTDIKEQLNKFEWEPPLAGEGDDYPMYYVSWDDAQEFVKKLNAMTGKKYRLPTEAEWEYAARGGAKSKGYKYAGSDNYDEVAWHYSGDEVPTGLCSGATFPPQPVRDNGPHPVGTKKANELGIYDMSGNVSEWVWDWWGEYSSAPQINPKGPSSGDKRVVRGGSWHLLQTEIYSRLTYWPDIYTNSMSGIGFRLAI